VAIIIFESGSVKFVRYGKKFNEFGQFWNLLEGA
jgi:hypothetical protein